MRFLLLCALLLFVGCGKPSQPTQEPKPDPSLKTAADALKALDQLQTATEVGISYQKYADLLITAKVAVAEAGRVLPAGTLRTKLDESITAFSMARADWENMNYVGPDNPSHPLYSKDMQKHWADAEQALEDARTALPK